MYFYFAFLRKSKREAWKGTPPRSAWKHSAAVSSALKADIFSHKTSHSVWNHNFTLSASGFIFLIGFHTISFRQTELLLLLGVQTRSVSLHWAFSLLRRSATLSFAMIPPEINLCSQIVLLVLSEGKCPIWESVFILMHCICIYTVRKISIKKRNLKITQTFFGQTFPSTGFYSNLFTFLFYQKMDIFHIFRIDVLLHSQTVKKVKRSVFLQWVSQTLTYSRKCRTCALKVLTESSFTRLQYIYKNFYWIWLLFM